MAHTSLIYFSYLLSERVLFNVRDCESNISLLSSPDEFPGQQTNKLPNQIVIIETVHQASSLLNISVRDM